MEKVLSAHNQAHGYNLDGSYVGDCEMCMNVREHQSCRSCGAIRPTAIVSNRDYRNSVDRNVSDRRMQQIREIEVQNWVNGYQRIGKWFKYFGTCAECPTVTTEYQSCPSCRQMRFPFLDPFDATSVCMQNLYNGYSTDDVLQRLLGLLGLSSSK